MERRWHLRHVEGEGLGAKVELDWRVGVYADDGVEGQLLRLGGEGRPEVGAVEREEDAARAHLVRIEVRVGVKIRVGVGVGVVFGFGVRVGVRARAAPTIASNQGGSSPRRRSPRRRRS